MATLVKQQTPSIMRFFHVQTLLLLNIHYYNEKRKSSFLSRLSYGLYLEYELSSLWLYFWLTPFLKNFTTINVIRLLPFYWDMFPVLPVWSLTTHWHWRREPAEAPPLICVVPTRLLPSSNIPNFGLDCILQHLATST